MVIRKRLSRKVFLGLFLFFFIGVSILRCIPIKASLQIEVDMSDTLYQVSTIDSLLLGFYEGQLPMYKLLQFGDFGIGTFHGLDGEMVILDGEVYKIDSKGKVSLVPPKETTPFAAVVFFDPSIIYPIGTIQNYDELIALLDMSLPNVNVFYGLRIDGLFSFVKTRSVAAQDKPYPPLVEVVLDQSVFEYKDISGTLVGFFCPLYVKGINVPGYHLHFISDDREAGGHLLDISFTGGVVAIHQITNFFLNLPKGEDFGELDLSLDRHEELDKVERD